MDSLLATITRIAKVYGINKVILFGSRARGDNTDKSDYDIAFVSPMLTQEQKNKITDKITELDTLHKIDAVFLKDLIGNDELTKNIQKDGVMLMSKFETKFNNYKKALSSLEEAISDFDKLKMLSIRDGVIQRFEFTTELAWKTVREYLLDEGVINIDTPKNVMREAYATNVIDDEQGWLAVLNDRNSTSHIYDENEADDTFDRIKNDHILLFKKLSDKLSSLT